MTRPGVVSGGIVYSRDKVIELVSLGSRDVIVGNTFIYCGTAIGGGGSGNEIANNVIYPP